MKEYNYKESIEITEKALDLLNVKRFLKKDKTSSEIMQDIEDYYCNQSNIDTYMVEYYMKEYPEIFGNPIDIFNYMTEDEFLSYCQKKYPKVVWGNEIIERNWIISVGGGT